MICNKMDNSDIDMSDRSVDWLFGVESLKTEKVLKKKALEKEYAGEKYFYDDYYTPYAVMRNIMEKIELQPEDVLYDLGSGYGRILFYALFVTKVGRCKGIELIPGRVKAALKAKDVLGLKDVDFVQGNVCEENFEDGTVFFMYNPFGRQTTKVVVNKLRNIAKRKKIKVISWGREITDFLNKQKDWLSAEQSIKSNDSGEVDIIVFESIADNVFGDYSSADKITEADGLLEQSI
ncbi:MAG: class I SAM-dependent methyltransferase [Candidatus Omnitrophica bacterium]|nr:class I SAM-dependent methyltransferase [Candidatus Omnitrophota bacterium]